VAAARLPRRRLRKLASRLQNRVNGYQPSNLTQRRRRSNGRLLAAWTMLVIQMALHKLCFHP
jgi:hypothetical protein